VAIDKFPVHEIAQFDPPGETAVASIPGLLRPAASQLPSESAPIELAQPPAEVPNPN
jgi:hypothetical protein